MKNSQAQKLLDKIQRDLMRNGLIVNTIVDDLKNLRPFAVEEEDPLLAKVIRLTYEHIDAYQTFDIPIPDDEPLDENEEVSASPDSKPEESLDYLLSLMNDTSIKNNEMDLREYSRALQDYAEEN
ncbi:MAG TPA: hypothetical protein VLN46_01240 [Gillisia sp.]|nr:hypothetical protein [Gillisia sp.]